MNKINREDVGIDLDDDILLKLSMLAHEQDITLNQYIEKLLKDYIKNSKNESVNAKQLLTEHVK